MVSLKQNGWVGFIAGVLYILACSALSMNPSTEGYGVLCFIVGFLIMCGVYMTATQPGEWKRTYGGMGKPYVEYPNPQSRFMVGMGWGLFLSFVVVLLIVLL